MGDNAQVSYWLCVHLVFRTVSDMFLKTLEMYAIAFIFFKSMQSVVHSKNVSEGFITTPSLCRQGEWNSGVQRKFLVFPIWVTVPMLEEMLTAE